MQLALLVWWPRGRSYRDEEQEKARGRSRESQVALPVCVCVCVAGPQQRPEKSCGMGNVHKMGSKEKASGTSGHASALVENDCGRAKKQLKHLYSGKTGSRAHACGPMAEERGKAERNSRHAMQSRPPCRFVSSGFTQSTCPLFILMRAAGPLHARFSSFSFHRNTQGT